MEAAIALPFFIMALLAVCSFFSLQILEQQLQEAMEYAAGCASAYYYALDNAESSLKLGGEKEQDIVQLLVQGTITAAYLRQKVIDGAGEEYLENSWLDGGIDALSILGSSFPDEEGNLDFVLSYRVRPPFLPGNSARLRFTQRVCRRVWTGSGTKDEDEAQEEVMVYITQTGTVYHLSADCTYLRLSIQAVSPQAASWLRSDDGSRYYACERCHPEGSCPVVYITKSGSRYHSNINCSGLKRGIQKVALSSVLERPACSRCADRK